VSAGAGSQKFEFIYRGWSKNVDVALLKIIFLITYSQNKAVAFLVPRSL